MKKTKNIKPSNNLSQPGHIVKEFPGMISHKTIDLINNEHPYPSPSKPSEEEELLKDFHKAFYNQDDKDGADYIRNRCLEEIDEIKIAKTNIIRDEKINEIIDAAYKSILDQLMSKLENSIAMKNDDLIYIPDSFESLKNKIDEILPGIDIRFSQNLKGNPIWGSETNTNTTEEEQEIKETVNHIVDEVNKLPATSRSAKTLLQKRFDTLIGKFQDKGDLTILGYTKKAFVRLFLWDNGIEKAEPIRYTSFDSFYKNIFIK